MKLRIEQMNPVVGDIEGNLSLILDVLETAEKEQVDLLVLPEMVLTGYPAEDILEYDSFRTRCYRANERIAGRSAKTAILFGTLTPNLSGTGRKMFNSALLCKGGQVVGKTDKILLPNYDVFDDLRYFEPGKETACLQLGELKLGVTICEDIWYNENEVRYHHYERNPARELETQGADILINLSASPFTKTKHESRLRMLKNHAQNLRLPVLYCNQAGGQTGLLFDGDSTILDSSGRVVAAAELFEPDRLDVEWDPGAGTMERLTAGRKSADSEKSARKTANAGGEEPDYRIWKALTKGIRDYLSKTGLPSRLVVGLSGGIDSALVLALACEAVGNSKVTALALPFRFTSGSSLHDARRLAENFGVNLHEIPIHGIYDQFMKALDPWFAGREFDVTEENLQSRIRGVLLMSWTNKFGGMLLTTGNKSELAVGYSTLYGDMNGGLNPVGDLWKTEVFRLCRWLNRVWYEKEMIPEEIIRKPPSAELRPDQKDTDTLPEYEILDEILRLHIELQKGKEEIVQEGFPEDIVLRVFRMIERSEFKRYQAPPILRISSKSFGSGRRWPIVQRQSFYN